MRTSETNRMLQELISCEDMDTFLVIGLTLDGKIELADNQYRWHAEGDTFDEAVLNYYNIIMEAREI